ncbi:MAG: archease, partial [Candidatus Omnitrophota bacterium]
LKKKCYTIIEHTADIGVAVEAGDLAGIFVNAAVAMFDIMAERRAAVPPESRSKLNVTLSAARPDELLIRWLNELLSLSGAKGLIFVDYQVHHLDDKCLDISVVGENVSYYRFNAEIKAATYHDLKLVKQASSCKAKVIFDV